MAIDLSIHPNLVWFLVFPEGTGSFTDNELYIIYVQFSL